MYKILSAAVLAAVFAAAAPSQAAPLIHVGACTGAACVPTEAGLSPQATPGFPAISFGPSTVGAFSVTGSATVTSGISFDTQTIAVSTTTGGTIDIFFSGVGAQGQGTVTIPTSYTTNAQVATTALVTENSWLDPTNTLFGHGTLLGTASFSGSGLQTASATKTLDTTAGLIELGEEYIVTLTGGCSAVLPCSANMTIHLAAVSPVVEPSSLLLLGGALVGLWLLARRRRIDDGMIAG